MSDETRTAQASAWVLLFTSTIALGATLAAVHAGRWAWAVGLLAVTLLLAWGSAAERAEQKANQAWEAR